MSTISVEEAAKPVCQRQESSFRKCVGLADKLAQMEANWLLQDGCGIPESSVKRVELSGRGGGVYGEEWPCALAKPCLVAIKQECTTASTNEQAETTASSQTRSCTLQRSVHARKPNLDGDGTMCSPTNGKALHPEARLGQCQQGQGNGAQSSSGVNVLLAEDLMQTMAEGLSDLKVGHDAVAPLQLKELRNKYLAVGDVQDFVLL
jgi:hypothetical protein